MIVPLSNHYLLEISFVESVAQGSKFKFPFVFHFPPFGFLKLCSPDHFQYLQLIPILWRIENLFFTLSSSFLFFYLLMIRFYQNYLCCFSELFGDPQYLSLISLRFFFLTHLNLLFFLISPKQNDTRFLSGFHLNLQVSFVSFLLEIFNLHETKSFSSLLLNAGQHFFSIFIMLFSLEHHPPLFFAP